MFSRPACVWSSAASTPVAGRRPPVRTSRTRATTSGGCSTTPASRRLLAPEEQHELASLGYGLTNAAWRTTRGSGDLRRGDFAGAAERLATIAEDLKPGWIAFVGKEAYRGAFKERPELGVQERRLGETRLFVLPSTSPANAAVPYAVRLKWFRRLRASSDAGRSPGGQPGRRRAPT